MSLRTFIAAVLVAGCLGCESRVLDGGPIEGHGGTGGQVNTGQGGTIASGSATGGSGATGGSSAKGGSGGSSCPISCGQSACPTRDGQPRVLATSPRYYQIGPLAVNADTLFWGTYPSEAPGEIRSMPLAGGPSTLLASNVVVSDLYLDGTTLYYVTDNRSGNDSLFAIPASGGTPRMIATGSTITNVTANASGIFFAQANGIMRVDRAGSTIAPINTYTSPTAVLWGFAVDETNVYWATYSNGGGLHRRALTSGDVTTLRTSSAPITYPTLDGDDIDFIEGTNTPATCASAIWSIAKAGGSPRLISPGTSGVDVGRVVLDGATLYWAGNSPHGAVLRMAKGQTPEILAPEQVNVSPPVVGAAAIYWVATGPDWGYEIRTLPK